MAKKKKPAKKELTGTQILRKTWRIISMGLSVLMFVFFAMIFLSILGAFIDVESLEQGNIAVIPLDGVITGNGEYGISKAISSEDFVKQLDRAEENKDIKGIILAINSPGGTPVATDEIARAVKQTEKPTIAVIRETGASGAYWVATAADKIYANRMSVTGSIGVQASSLEFAGLLTDYNVTYRKLIAGRLKDAGTPLREMTPEEKQLFQDVVDSLHDEFINAVAENRNLPRETVTELATGFIYLGSDAKELGLVDELGTKEDALDYLEDRLNITAEPVTYKRHKTFADVLSEVSADSFYNIGRGMGAYSQDIQFSFT